jgi:polyisoprenyl-phosphate glycosyltransferase
LLQGFLQGHLLNFKDVKVSVVIPVFNEGETINIAYRFITEELQKVNLAFELIFVDDGSSDDTYQYLKTIAENDPRVKVVKFANNCGSHIAIRAGLSYATGNYACFIACDMQEPPYLIYEMLQAIKEPVEIIWAVRNKRKDSLSTILFAKTFYFFARRMVSKNIPPSGASMFLISEKVVKALRLYPERNLTLEGLFATMGFRSAFIHYERQERIAGKSKWTVGKKIKLFLDFFVAYSSVPLRFVSVVGILFAIVGFIWTLYIIIRQFAYGDLISGWPALLSVLLIGFGVTNIALGIIAEYLWRTLDEARKRPKYIIDTTLNISNEITSVPSTAIANKIEK